MCIEDQLKKNGFVSTQGLTDWQEQQLQASVRKGEAMRLKNGVYAHIDALAGTMVDIHLIVPNGILCLWSAWSVYNLTTQIPNAYYVQIRVLCKGKTKCNVIFHVVSLAILECCLYSFI